MTDLDVIKAAYDRVGITYVVRVKENWSYLFLYGGNSKKYFKEQDLDFLCRVKPFIEFKDGEVASY